MEARVYLFPQDGRPLYIEQLGSIDLKKMLQITTMDRMLQNLVVEYEKLALFRLVSGHMCSPIPRY